MNSIHKPSFSNILSSPVGSAPELLEPLSDLTVTAETKVKLTCKISAGDPKAKITWYHKDKEVKVTKNVKVAYADDEATLTIADVELTHAGWYRCEASNKIGRVETQCTLTVNST